MDFWPLIGLNYCLFWSYSCLKFQCYQIWKKIKNVAHDEISNMSHNLYLELFVSLGTYEIILVTLGTLSLESSLLTLPLLDPVLDPMEVLPLLIRLTLWGFKLPLLDNDLLFSAEFSVNWILALQLFLLTLLALMSSIVKKLAFLFVKVFRTTSSMNFLLKNW